MKYLSKLSFLIILFPLFTSAQSNYKPGYVVTLKGDTLHGYIDYKQWDRNPTQIGFRLSPGDNRTSEYTAKDVKAFGVTELEVYERHVVQISQAPIDINNLKNSLDTTSRTDTVFLHLITKGKYASLYTYTDDIKERMYLADGKHSEPKELMYSAYYNTETSSVAYNNRFRIQLQYILQKDNITNDALGQKITEANYSENEILSIVRKINGNSSKEFVAKSPSGARWFAGVAASANTFKFSEGFQIFDNHPSSNAVAPQINAGFDFLFNKSVQKFYLRAELSFNTASYSVSGSYSEGNVPSVSSLSFKQSNILFTPQAVYNIYNKETLKIFLDAGASLHYAFYNHHQFITGYANGVSPTVRDNYPQFKSFWVSVPLKAGVEINRKFEVSVCYVPSTVITGYSLFSGNITSYQVGFNYLFGSK